jgi:hypothetical protein
MTSLFRALPAYALMWSVSITLLVIEDAAVMALLFC